MKYYSPKTKGFYDDEFNTVPSDAIQLTDQEYQHFFTSLCSGKDLVHDNGRLLVIDREIPLDDLKQSKIKEINDAFRDAEQQPVSVGGHKLKGGFESGLALDAQRRMLVEYAAANPLAGISTADFFDIHGATVTLPLNSETELDALDVCLAVGQASAINSFKCAQLIAAVRAANSIEAVSTIHW